MHIDPFASPPEPGRTSTALVAFEPGAGSAVYAATKFTVWTPSLALRRELKPSVVAFAISKPEEMDLNEVVFRPACQVL